MFGCEVERISRRPEPNSPTTSMPKQGVIIRTLAQATICSLLISGKKEIRDVETQTTCARAQGEGRAGNPAGEETAAELASWFRKHPTMIDQWKHALLEGASGVFERGGRNKPEIDEEQVKEFQARSCPKDGGGSSETS